MATFIPWLLEKGFLIETPYPKVGDILVVSKSGEITFVDKLAREGVLQQQFPESELHFYIALTAEEWKRLYAQFQEE